AASDLVGLGELSEGLNKRQVDCLVNLRQLLEESRENDLLQGKDVALHLSISADLGQDGRDLLADRQRVEVDLENVVEVPDLRAGALQKRLGQRIAEEASTGGGLV